jgi:hypothetical protein
VRYFPLHRLRAVGEGLLGAAATLIEPAARTTAPAVLAAALWLAERWPYALMIVSSADHDHVIPDAAGFRAAVSEARTDAEAGGIITFGIRPDPRQRRRFETVPRGNRRIGFENLDLQFHALALRKVSGGDGSCHIMSSRKQ